MVVFCSSYYRVTPRWFKLFKLVHSWKTRTRLSYAVNIQWRRHQMETFSTLLAICAGNSPVPGEFPHKGQWRGALMFSLICTRINGLNNGEGGDLRRYRAHYDATVMPWLLMTWWHRGRVRMAAISQTTFSNAPSLMKMYVFRFKFHRNLFPRVALHNRPSLVQIMTWHWKGDKPLFEPTMAKFTVSYKRRSASMS